MPSPADSTTRMALTSASPAHTVLHYLGPVATAIYFLAAKTVATCLLQQPSRRPGSKRWRYMTIALQSAIVSATVAEGVIAIVRTFRQSAWDASQDYIVYLLVAFATHTFLLIGIAETKRPIWHPYLGAWLVALCSDIPIIALQGLAIPENEYAKSRMAFCVVRALLLLVLCILISYRTLSGRQRSVKLDAETEALLSSGVNGNGLNGNSTKPTGSPTDSLLPNETTAVTKNGAKDGDDDTDIDSDSEEPERDKELKAQQKQRLQQSGSWINYLKEFSIFIPIIFPWKDRLVQGCLGAIGFSIIATRALNILVPRQLGLITDALTNVATTGDMPWRAVGLWVLYTSLGSSAGIPLIKQIAQVPVSQYGYKAITTTSFRHIMGLSMDFHNDKNSGELIRAIYQGAELHHLVSFALFEVLPMFFDLIVAFIYVSLLFDIYLGMILFAIGFTYIWIGAKVTVWNLKQRRDFNNAWRLESKVQNEAINNWQTVSHFNRGLYETERYTKTVDGHNLAEWKYFRGAYIGSAVQQFIMLIGRLAAFTLAIYRVSQGRAPVGSFVTLVQYWRSIESPLASLSFSVRKVSSMLTDSERLLQLLTTKPTVTDAPNAKELQVTAGEVRFDNVDFSYDPRKSTLKGVDFAVKPGQTIALVGETGGGKSTILKLLYRYYDVSNGAIRIDDQDIREVTLDSLRDSFGMVPQDPSLFNVSIEENIKYARLDASLDEVKDACRAAAIHDKIESFPDGYAAKVGERGVKLSGGELQRVSIARAILRQPKIVLLDEATSMIDAETEAVIQDAFKRLTAQRTTFIVAHRLSTIQHADLILVIHDGKIVERGTHDELFRRKGKYVALWSKQLSKDVKEVGNSLDVAREDEALIELEPPATEGQVDTSSSSSSSSDGRKK